MFLKGVQNPNQLNKLIDHEMLLNKNESLGAEPQYTIEMSTYILKQYCISQYTVN